jgi:hypothetical protein
MVGQYGVEPEEMRGMPFCPADAELISKLNAFTLI